MDFLLDFTLFAVKSSFIVLTIKKLKYQQENSFLFLQDCILWLILIAWEYLFPDNEPRLYLLKTIIQVLFLSEYVKRGGGKKRGQISSFIHICLIELLYEVLYLGGVVSGAISTWILKIENEHLIVLYCILFMLIILYVFKCNKIELEYVFSFVEKAKYRIVIVYAIVCCIKIVITFTDIDDARALKSAIIAMVISLAIFTVISGREKHQTAAEKVKMEEDNRRLSAQLHKSKEIFPAMLLALKQMADKEAGIDSGQAHQLLMEVHDLYGHQLNENHQEDLLLKTFGSTGFQTLDMQLQGYIQEAAEKGINMDIFIPGPIDELIKAEKINQLRFQRAIGDMVRNAFHAIEKTGNSEGEIFVIIGCGEKDILEIVVMDNGVDFPKEVLDNFGKRGVTLDGTGNGLADLAEFAKAEKASLVLEQYTADEEFFSKQLSVLFDGKSRVEIKA